MKRRGSRPPKSASHSQKSGQSGQSGQRGQSGRPQKGRSHAGRGSPPGKGKAKSESFSTDGRWVIGIHSCSETVKTRPHAIGDVFFRPDWEHSEALREIAELLKNMEIPVQTRSMESLSTLGSGHQGAAIHVTEDPVLDWKSLAEPGKRLVLILDGIEDPQNLGAMLRTAWLAGVDGILIPEDRAVGLTPTVCKIASGGAEHVPVEAHTNFGPAIERLKEIGFWTYGLAEAGKYRPWDLKFPDKVVWVVGSEGGGMRVPTERMCDELVRLPQVTSGSSYNASIAIAMALAETCRQFGKPE